MLQNRREYHFSGKKKKIRDKINAEEWNQLSVFGYDGIEVIFNSEDFWDVFCYGN